MDYPITPVAFTEVSCDDRFWLHRLATNREVTIPYHLHRAARLPSGAAAGNPH